MAQVRIKIHEFDAAAHAARQPHPVLDEIPLELAPTVSVDESKNLAEQAVKTHTKRTIRNLSHAKGGNFVAIVHPKG